MWLYPSFVFAIGILGAPSPSDVAPSPSWVLPPSASAQVETCLQLKTALVPDHFLTAAIDGDHVDLKFDSAPDSPLHVQLLHPETAPPEAARAAGVALVRKDRGGGVADRAYGEIVSRLRACASPIVWTRIEPRPAPTPTQAPPSSGVMVDAIRGDLDRARNRVAVNRFDEAKATLRALPKELSAEAAVEVALTWRLAGEPGEAKRILDAVEHARPPLDTYIAVVRSDNERLARALENLDPKDACSFAYVAELQASLGDHAQAIVTATRVRTLDPNCLRAWEIEVSELALHGDPDRAISVGDDAVRRHPQDSGLLVAVASARLQSGRTDAAIALLERVAHRASRPSGVLRVLLGALVRDPERREASRARLEARVASPEADFIDRFLLGVVLHYENDFVGSNALLLPLEEKLGGEDRFHIYRAMNDFNLGDRPAALARLETAAKRDAPDPDIYYCLAELLRDTDRPRALDGLERYAAASQSDPMSNPAKEHRIRRMMEGLRACMEDERPVCEGEWEHPRLRHANEEGDQRRRVWVIGGVLLAVTGLAGLIRRSRASRHDP